MSTCLKSNFNLTALEETVQRQDDRHKAQTYLENLLPFIKRWAAYENGDMSLVDAPKFSQEYIYAQSSGQTIGIYTPDSGSYKLTFPNAEDLTIHRGQLNRDAVTNLRHPNPEVQEFIEAHLERAQEDRAAYLNVLRSTVPNVPTEEEPITIGDWLSTVMRNRYIPWLQFNRPARHFLALVWSDDINYCPVKFNFTRRPVTQDQLLQLKAARDEYKRHAQSTLPPARVNAPSLAVAGLPTEILEMYDQ